MFKKYIAREIRFERVVFRITRSSVSGDALQKYINNILRCGVTLYSLEPFIPNRDLNCKTDKLFYFPRSSAGCVFETNYAFITRMLCNDVMFFTNNIGCTYGKYAYEIEWKQYACARTLENRFTRSAVRIRRQEKNTFPFPISRRVLKSCISKRFGGKTKIRHRLSFYSKHANPNVCVEQRTRSCDWCDGKKLRICSVVMRWVKSIDTSFWIERNW